MPITSQYCVPENACRWARLPPVTPKGAPRGAMSPISSDAQILALQGGTFPTSSGSPFLGFESFSMEGEGDWQRGLAEVPSLSL